VERAPPSETQVEGSAGMGSASEVRTDDPGARSSSETGLEAQRRPVVHRRTGTNTDFEHHTEYQNGLAAMMFAASVFGLDVVTSNYKHGCATGLDEASMFQNYTDRSSWDLGCESSFAAIAGYFAPLSDADLAGISERCSNRLPKNNGPQGALFSEERLKAAQRAGERFGDPTEINAYITIFTVGYNMGFAHRWESVNQEDALEKMTASGCEFVVQTSRPPLAPQQAGAAEGKCRDVARATRDEFGRKLRCLLVGSEGNSDLSGLQTKPGCP